MTLYQLFLRLFRLAVMAFLVAFFCCGVGCVSSVFHESGDDDYVDGWVDVDSEEYKEYNLLNIEVLGSSQSSDGTPLQFWVVSSDVAEPTLANFAKVRDLLTIAESNGMCVAIEFRGITHIPDYAFYYGDTSSSSFNFNYRSALVNVSGDDVTHIGSNAFGGEESYSYSELAELNLRSVSFANVVEIGHYTFYRCMLLTSVHLPSLVVVPSYAFSECMGLEDVTFAGATTVEAYAFRHCYGLTSLTVPSSATVSPYAFLGVSPTPAVLPLP